MSELFSFCARFTQAELLGRSAKNLVELLGGRAWVDSEVGQGAIFSVLLPVKPPVQCEDGVEMEG